MMNVHFILTDQAVYSLDSRYGFKNRISLRNIEKITTNRKDKYLNIYENNGVYEFSMPLEIKNRIEEAALKIGNDIGNNN